MRYTILHRVATTGHRGSTKGEKMKKLLILAAACAAVLASLVPSATAVTGNYQDDFAHDYVGLLVFYTAPDANGDIFSHRCSGTLISPRIVVTAGHCTEGVDKGRIYWAQSAAPNYSPTAFGGLGGDPTTGYPYEDFGQPDTSTFSRADNYGFHNFDGFPNTRDVGVVVLDADYTPPSGISASAWRRHDRYLPRSKRSRTHVSRSAATGSRPGPGARVLP